MPLMIYMFVIKQAIREHLETEAVTLSTHSNVTNNPDALLYCLNIQR